MLIGIYGGSFNPIHLGHTALAQWLIESRRVEAVWLMVSPHNPLKTAADLAPDETRLRLAHLAVSPPVEVSDFEFSLPRPSYTADTLAALRRAYPQHRFVLIIGADNWLTFSRWHHPDDILAHHDIIVYPRPGYEIDTATLPPQVSLVQAPLLPYASSDIRRAIRTDATYCGRGLHPAVWQTIVDEQVFSS